MNDTLPNELPRKMTLLTMIQNGRAALGLKLQSGVLDVARAAKVFNIPVPATMDQLLQTEAGASLNRLLEAFQSSDKNRVGLIEPSNIEYGPIVTHPEKIICVGLNYRRHALEVKLPIPQYPVLFSKFNNSLAAHNSVIRLPVDVAAKFDYETELVIVIGKKGKNLSETGALSHVAGYAVGNDLSARDLQFDRGGQWLAGKTLDCFAPIGPYMVTADQVDPNNLGIRCLVNGEVQQSSNTSDFIFDPAHVVSYISHYMTLQPGDVIFTGTPEGVILGKPPAEQVWLKAGDKIRCSIDGLGELAFSFS